MKIWIYLLLVVAGPTLSFCAYESEEELFPPRECDATSVSYSGDILPILENNCFICHASHVRLGGIVLEGYSNIFLYTTQNPGRLEGSVSWDGSATPMPQNDTKLDFCSINRIVQWVEQGRKNN